MKLRITLIVAIVSVLLLVGIGAVLAATPGGTEDTDWGWHEQMHTSEQMRTMHRQMPEEMQGECDRMHVRMRATDREDRPMMGESARPGWRGPMHGGR